MTTTESVIDWDALGLDRQEVAPVVEGVQLAEKQEPVKSTIDWDVIDSGGLKDEEEPSLVTKALEKGRTGILKGASWLGKTAYHTAGVGVGALNAPFAFYWGMSAAEFEDPQQFYKMPGWQQLAVMMGGGFVSAVESIAKPGSFGKQATDYYKGVTGKTIEQSLEESLRERGFRDAGGTAKLVAPALDTLYNIIADPTTLLVPAAQLARLRVPKGFVGQIPKHVADQIEYLNALDDIELKESVKQILKNAYDEKLWGIQEGGTFQNVKPTPTPFRGGITEGESFQNVQVPYQIPKVISGEKPPERTGMGQAVPREPATVPEAAQRIMDAARLRKDRYIAEGNLAKKSGVSALGFINQVRKRLGLPSYEDAAAANKQVDELYGQFASALMSKSFNRAPNKEVQFFDLGALVKAAQEVFGPHDTLKALKIIEAEDSEIGRTLKAAMPDLEKTLGSGQFSEPVEGVAKVARQKPPSPVSTVPVTPPPVTPKAPPVQIKSAEPLTVSKPTTTKQLFDEELDTTKGIVDELEEATGVRIEPSDEPLVVPGKSFKHVVPKVGANIPGVGEITGQIQLPNGDFWFRYVDEKTGARRYKSMNTIMEMAQAHTPPRQDVITMDFMGISEAYRIGKQAMEDFRLKLVKARNKRPQEPFQKQIPDTALFTPDWDQVVKRRKTGKVGNVDLYAPPVKGVERNIMMNSNEIPEGIYRDNLENPIRNFEYAGPELKELIYYPIREAWHDIVIEKKRFNNWLNGLRHGVSEDSSRRVGVYAIAQQKRIVRDPVTKLDTLYMDGIERLKASGITDIPKLTSEETRIYNAIRSKFDELYDRLTLARVASGKKPFPKVENYTTYMLDFAEMEARGINPMYHGDRIVNQQYLHPNATPFRFAKARSLNKYPVETDIFNIMNGYVPRAIEHINLTPRIAKSRELLGLMPDPGDPLGKAKIELWDTKPNLARFLDDWLTRQSGVKQFSKYGSVRMLERALQKLNNNLVIAYLSYNLRTVANQPLALANTIPEIGVINTAAGVEDLFRAAFGNGRLWKEVFAKSKVLLGRSYDVSLDDAIRAVKAGKFGAVTNVVGKWGMRPIQWFDIGTAWITWRGAYRKALKEGLEESKAIRYADDVVIKTQASGLPVDTAKLQSTTAGKALSLLQTFVINDFGYFLRDVVGVGNPRMSQTDAFKKAAKYVIAVTAFNSLYEDVLGIPSPFPAPITAAREALEEGKTPLEVWAEVGKELASKVPIVGGAIRYGSSPFGVGGELVNKAMTEKWTPGKAAEWLAKFKGIPGTQQFRRWQVEGERGEPLGVRIIQKRTLTPDDIRERKARWSDED